MVSTWTLISKSSSSFKKSLGIVMNAPVTITITFSLMFDNFLVCLAKVQIHVSIFDFFEFHAVVHQFEKSSLR